MKTKHILSPRICGKVLYVHEYSDTLYDIFYNFSENARNFSDEKVTKLSNAISELIKFNRKN